MDIDTGLLLLIAVILGLIFFRQKDCEERIWRAYSEGERRMLTAIRVSMDYLLKTDEDDEDDR